MEDAPVSFSLLVAALGSSTAPALFPLLAFLCDGVALVISMLIAANPLANMVVLALVISTLGMLLSGLSLVSASPSSQLMRLMGDFDVGLSAVALGAAAYDALKVMG